MFAMRNKLTLLILIIFTVTGIAIFKYQKNQKTLHVYVEDFIFDSIAQIETSQVDKELSSLLSTPLWTENSSSKGLAEKIEPNAEFTEFKVTLRKDLITPLGFKLTAESYIESLRRTFEIVQADGLPYDELAQTLEFSNFLKGERSSGIEALGENELVFRFKSPQKNFINLLDFLKYSFRSSANFTKDSANNLEIIDTISPLILTSKDESKLNFKVNNQIIENSRFSKVVISKLTPDQFENIQDQESAIALIFNAKKLPPHLSPIAATLLSSAYLTYNCKSPIFKDFKVRQEFLSSFKYLIKNSGANGLLIASQSKDSLSAPNTKLKGTQISAVVESTWQGFDSDSLNKSLSDAVTHYFGSEIVIHKSQTSLIRGINLEQQAKNQIFITRGTLSGSRFPRLIWNFLCSDRLGLYTGSRAFCDDLASTGQLPGQTSFTEWLSKEKCSEEIGQFRGQYYGTSDFKKVNPYFQNKFLLQVISSDSH